MYALKILMIYMMVYKKCIILLIIFRRERENIKKYVTIDEFRKPLKVTC